MLSIDPKNISTREFHAYMLGAVAPRPIAFASTVDEAGIANLAPFSFFNAFSSNPPILIFSANRKVKDNTTKDTFANIQANREVVINAVSYSFVRKMALASIEYPKEVDEFKKAGFTPVPSEKVKPFRVGESPVHFECKVNDIIQLGHEGGAGNLFICQVMLMHINENILTNGRIDPDKIDLCARMGGTKYARASGDAVFEIVQPVDKIGMGFDGLPEEIRTSEVLTGNDLAQLASAEKIPTAEELKAFQETEVFKEFSKRFVNDKDSFKWHLHDYARQLLKTGDVNTAWMVLLQQPS